MPSPIQWTLCSSCVIFPHHVLFMCNLPSFRSVPLNGLCTLFTCYLPSWIMSWPHCSLAPTNPSSSHFFYSPRQVKRFKSNMGVAQMLPVDMMVREGVQARGRSGCVTSLRIDFITGNPAYLPIPRQPVAKSIKTIAATQPEPIMSSKGFDCSAGETTHGGGNGSGVDPAVSWFSRLSRSDFKRMSDSSKKNLVSGSSSGGGSGGGVLSSDGAAQPACGCALSDPPGRGAPPPVPPGCDTSRQVASDGSNDAVHTPGAAHDPFQQQQQQQQQQGQTHGWMAVNTWGQNMPQIGMPSIPRLEIPSMPTMTIASLSSVPKLNIQSLSGISVEQNDQGEKRMSSFLRPDSLMSALSTPFSKTPFAFQDEKSEPSPTQGSDGEGVEERGVSEEVGSAAGEGVWVSHTGLYLWHDATGGWWIKGVTSDSPAECDGRARLGDTVLAVDGVSIENMGVKEARSLLQGAPESVITIAVQPRGGGCREFACLMRSHEETWCRRPGAGRGEKDSGAVFGNLRDMHCAASPRGRPQHCRASNYTAVLSSSAASEQQAHASEAPSNSSPPSNEFEDGGALRENPASPYLGKASSSRFTDLESAIFAQARDRAREEYRQNLIARQHVRDAANQAVRQTLRNSV